MYIEYGVATSRRPSEEPQMSFASAPGWPVDATATKHLEFDAALIGMHRSPRMAEGSACDATSGQVSWSPAKSLWLTAMAGGAVIGGPLYFSWGGLVLFVVTTAITICLGHSLGMHRRLIHNAFDCPLWLERLFVYLGTLVGMAGPSGMIWQHDIRDWAQREADCHPFLGHKSSFWRDAYWQLHCELKLAHPPFLKIEPRIANDPFYRFIDRTVMAQQLPWAVMFFAVGGLPWVVWGVCMRVSFSLVGHWLVGYFAHNRGPRHWHIRGAGVQGYNVPYVSLFTMGESHHNNHHAFPGSARLSQESGELDPGWWVLLALERLGLVWNVHTPADLPARPNLERA
jgi:fatty-acid desaturase